ncbi:hypothetical protein [Xenorhabdus sp. Sc-CR9]|uniref:hypothetical protein n=1 Tax=Xenorhabdus sp. Sc-CR9 TaxID=2584468 RepID=UPI001F2D33EC|nr:hypothetical protein [Xenorhabdus sp. Sc-CR9]
MNQFGLVSWRLPGNLFNAIELCRENSIQSLQIDFGGNNRGDLLASYNLHILREAAINNNINITAIALNLYNDIGIITSTNECKLIFFEAIRLADRLKVSTLFIPSFRKSMIENDMDIINTANFLQWCCDVAGMDFIIASENVLTPEKSKFLCCMVNRNNFKLIFDPSNLHMAKVDSCDYFLKLFNHIHTDVHIKPLNGGEFSFQSFYYQKIVKTMVFSPNSSLKKFTFFSENDYRERKTSLIKEDLIWLQKNFMEFH